MIVATDDDRIRDHALAFGAEVAMTSPDCRNGTERCAEAVATLGLTPEIVVNLQGDAPLTPAWFVEDLVAGLRADPDAQVATPVLRCTGAMRADLIADRHAGRVGGTTAVFGHEGRALYFSKEVIPFVRVTWPPTRQARSFITWASMPIARRRWPNTPPGPKAPWNGWRGWNSCVFWNAAAMCAASRSRHAVGNSGN